MTPIEVFLSYSHRDEKLRQELVKHLNILRHQGVIGDWHDRKILPGDEWKNVLDDHLKSAGIILLLISADFVSSDYCYNIEMKRAMQRHNTGQAVVIPVILRNVDWKGAPFGRLQALPTDGIPITSPHWKNRDEALTIVAKGIRSVVETRRKRAADLGRVKIRSLVGPKRSTAKPRTSSVRRSETKSISPSISRFDQDVAKLYRLLGYKVDEGQAVSTKTSVLICEQTVRGGPVVRLYVQCMGQRKGVSPSVCRQFIADFKSIPEERGITGAVLVTRLAPARDVRNSVTSAKCRVLGFSELFDELLNVNAILSAYTAWYERQEIYLSYLPLKCSKRGQQLQKTKAQEADIVREIYSWLSDTERLFVILGDFGTGKTTIAQRLKYELANKYLAGIAAPVPVYIPLRNYESIASLEKFIEAQLQNELGVHVPFGKFLEFVTQGKLLLLLDGFDEMGQQVDEEKRRSNFEELLPLLLASPKNILTCRPAYFLTDQELDSVIESVSQYSLPIGTAGLVTTTRKSHEAFLSAVERWSVFDSNTFQSLTGIRSVQISELTKGDVDHYVVNFMKRVGKEDGESIKTLRERIRRTYDLEDLARRPVLLNMIVQTVPLLPADKEASPSVIYGAYTNTWMNHEYAKGQVRMLVPAAEKRAFMQTLAWQMYLDGVVDMHYSKLTPHLSRFFKVQNRMAEFIATDIQACSFLERDQDGRFRFSHKSFLEYFAAEYLRERIKKRDYDDLRASKLADAVCFFLGDMVHADAALLQQFQTQLVLMLNRGDKDKSLNDNVVRVFSKARMRVSGLRAKNTTWDGIRFRGNSFSGEFQKPVWHEVLFEHCSWSDLTLTDITASNVQINDGHANRVIFKNIYHGPSMLDYPALRFNSSVLDQVGFEGACNAVIVESSLKSVNVSPVQGSLRITSCKVENSDIEQSLKDLTIANTKLNRSNLTGASVQSENTGHFLDTIRQRWKGTRDTKTVKWQNLVLSQCLLTWWDFSRTDIIDCKFQGCWFLACRFRDVQQMQAFLESNTLRCKYAFLCLRNTKQDSEGANRLRSDNDLLRLLHGLSPQASNKISPEWLGQIRFFKDPTQAMIVGAEKLSSPEGLMAPHTVDDLLRG